MSEAEHSTAIKSDIDGAAQMCIDVSCFLPFHIKPEDHHYSSKLADSLRDPGRSGLHGLQRFAEWSPIAAHWQTANADAGLRRDGFCFQ